VFCSWGPLIAYRPVVMPWGFASLFRLQCQGDIRGLLTGGAESKLQSRREKEPFQHSSGNAPECAPDPSP
jgi:hypothetical protein